MEEVSAGLGDPCPDVSVSVFLFCYFFYFSIRCMVGSTVGRTMFAFTVPLGATIANNISRSFGVAPVDVVAARKSIK